MSESAKRKCFVISPIAKEGTPEHNAADWFLEIVREALKADFDIERADDHKKTGMITTHIIEQIKSADLIVADLTNHNPNVHYELGVAHALNKHVIPMMTKGERLPFDNMQMRTIFYSRDHPKDQTAAVEALRVAAKVELSGEVQNPVTYALGTLKLSEGDDRDKVIATVSAQLADNAAELQVLRDVVEGMISTAYPSVSGSGGTFANLFGTLAPSHAPEPVPPFRISDQFKPSKVPEQKKD